jgi:RHS repeat-associated protein
MMDEGATLPGEAAAPEGPRNIPSTNAGGGGAGGGGGGGGGGNSFSGGGSSGQGTRAQSSQSLSHSELSGGPQITAGSHFTHATLAQPTGESNDTDAVSRLRIAGERPAGRAEFNHSPPPGSSSIEANASAPVSNLEAATSALGDLPVISPIISRDDGDWGYRERGIWNSGPESDGWRGDYRILSTASSSASASWVAQFEPGTYEVFATWPSHAENTQAATFEIFDGSQSRGAVSRDQREAADDRAFEGTAWESLGVYSITTGVATVKVTNQGTGALIADGVLFAMPRFDGCTFDENLTGWLVEEQGGSPDGKGSVIAADCQATLREGDSFITTLSQSFVIPAGATSLRFEYDALQFDTASQGLIRDAFDVALIDETGASLVPTFLPGRDAFFNYTDGVGAAVGVATTKTGKMVTLSLVDAPVGSQARLEFRLLNNDNDVNSSIRIVGVALPEGASPVPEEAHSTLAFADHAANSVSRVSAVGANRVDFATTPITSARGNTPPEVFADPPPDNLSIGIKWRKGQFPDDDTIPSSTFKVVPDSNQVVMTPVVIELDGVGAPEIVFSTFIGRNVGSTQATGLLRAVHGDTGEELWSAQETVIDAFTGVAAGDIDLDGRSEIIAVDLQGFLKTFSADGKLKWTSDASVFARGGSVSIANIDGVGTPEIVFGATVFDSNGKQLWTGSSGGGYNNDVGPLSIVADVDLDGRVEIIAGRSVYRADGSTLQEFSVPDGFAAVGNFDTDRYPEIVLVASSSVYLLQHDSPVPTWTLPIPGGGPSRGGAPTIADVDGDDKPDITVAGRFAYTAINSDGTVKWSVPVEDISSYCTGSSVFDLDGDGSAEVLYGDELRFYVFRGSDGHVLSQLDRGSSTVLELPVVADVDADGSAEIVVVSNDWYRGQGAGILVLTSGNGRWSDTRPIWNQHSYHITNVNDDGSIPLAELNSWELYNNYRRNQQITGTAIFPPTITASAPSSAAQAGSTIVLTGEARADGKLADGMPNSIVSVALNGTPVDVLDINGNFFASVTVLPGRNKYAFTARDAAGQIVSTELTVTGTQASANAVDFAQLTDITASFGPVYGRTSYNARLTQLSVDLATNNRGTFDFDAPLLIGITNINDPTVSVLGADGVTPDGIPYFKFTPTNSAQSRLQPGETSRPVTINFHTPREMQFAYELVILGKLNEAPAFVSLPGIEALVGQAYRYDSDAVDLDGDPLTYEMLIGPPTGDGNAATFNTATGLFTWLPTTEDLGNREVLLRASDGRGGVAEQRFVLSVIEPPPNRPPVITSTPALVATAGQELVTNGSFEFTALEENTREYVVPSGSENLDGWQVAGDSGVDLVVNSYWTPSQGEQSISLNWLSPSTISQTIPTRAGQTYTLSFDIAAEVYGGGMDRSLDVLWNGQVIASPSFQYSGQDGSHMGWTTYRYPVLGTGNDVLSFRSTTPANFGPALDNVSVAPGLTYEYDVDAADSDGNTLTYLLTEMPPGMSIDPATGLIEWNPTEDQIGDHTVAVQVSDGRGGVALQEYIVCVTADSNNRAPVITSDPITDVGPAAIPFGVQSLQSVATWHDTTTDITRYYGITPSAMSWTEANDFARSIGGSLVSIESAAENAFIANSFSIAEDYWIGLTSRNGDWTDPETWTWSDGTPLVYQNWRAGQPDQGFDDGEDDRYGAMNFSAANPGEWDNYPNAVFRRIRAIVELGSFQYRYQVDAIDPDGDVLTYSLLDGPTGMQMDEASGLVTWDASAALRNSDHPVTVRVDDGRGGVDDQSFMVHVRAGGGEIRGTKFEDREQSIRVTVPGTADPWLAGMPDGASASGGDTAPAHSPVQIFGIPFTEGQRLRFAAQGGVSADPDFPLLAPDGGSLQTHSSGAENGIASYVAPISSLVGVFLDQAIPTSTPAPLDSENDPDSVEIAPALKQVFFIGDGRTSAGLQQQITVPPGATRLFLGVMDGFGWFNNPGAFTVEVTSESKTELVGWPIYLDQNNNGRRDVGESSTVTDINGDYAFTGLPPGSYIVREVPQAAWRQTFPAAEAPRLLLGPTPYLSKQDSPFVGLDFAYSYFEDFEDHLLDAPGVSTPTGGIASIVFGPTSHDSVDGDDGAVDGNGLAGESYYSSQGAAGLAFEFDDIALEALPTHVGIVWTDGGGAVRFEAFAGNGTSLGVVNGSHADDSVFGETAEDRFYGVVSERGISRITISNESGGIEVDHLQYGRIIPQPGSHFVVLGSDEVVSAIDFGNQQIASATNLNPLFTSTPPVFATEGSLYRYDAIAADQDNDVVLYDLVSAPTGMAIHERYGTLVWTPISDQLGEHTVVIRADDGRGGIALQSFVITVRQPNSPPDFSTEALPVATVDRHYKYRLSAVDAESDTIRFEADAPLPAGIMLNPQTGTISWMPTGAQVGNHVLRIAAFDVRTIAGRPEERIGGRTVRDFVLSVSAQTENRPPRIVAEPRTTAIVGRPYHYSAFAEDPNADLLSYQLISGPNGAILDQATGEFTWTPAQIPAAPPTVHIVVTDGRGGEDERIFELSVGSQLANVAPEIISTPPAEFTVFGRTYRYDLVAEDLDHDPLQWSLDAAPAGMAIDNSTGVLLWTPREDQLSEHDVIVRVQDPFGGFHTQSFAVTVSCNNLPPTITSTPVTAAAPEVPYYYAVRATDPERDTLMFELLTKPDGMTIDERTGFIRWTPSLVRDAGQTRDVTVQVTDTHGGRAQQSFQIEVALTAPNRPPAFTSTPKFFAVGGELYEYVLSAEDPDGDQVTFSFPAAFTPPANMTLTGGVLRWTPPNQNEALTLPITILASDPAGLNASQGFAIIVRPNRPPEILSQPNDPDGAIVGSTYRVDIRARDPDGDAITYELSAQPQGMTVDNLGRILWTPAPSQRTGVGDEPHTVTVVVTDTRGATDELTWHINVGADTTPPNVTVQIVSGSVLVGAIEPTFNIGASTTLQVRATDNLSVAALQLDLLYPDGTRQQLPLDAGRSHVSLLQPGRFEAVATATDAAGSSATANLFFRVVDPNSLGVDVEITSPASQDGLANEPLMDRHDIIATLMSLDEGEVLTQYRVLYARLESVDTTVWDLADPDYVTLATGDLTAQNLSTYTDTLAVFDPTILENGPYAIVVEAFNTTGIGWIEPVIVSVEGNLKLGNFRQEFVDLSLPLAGIPITITRVYDSLQASTSGDFGYGWSLGIVDAKIRESYIPEVGFIPGKTKIYLTNPDGQRVGFTYHERLIGGFSFAAVFEPYFVPDPGVYDQLSVDDVAGRGAILEGLGGPVNFDRYTLTTRDGTQYTYDQFAGLQNVTDTNGNKLDFTRDGITSSSGARVDFQRDGRGRITTIAYFDGGERRELRYRYSAAGDLAAFIEPVSDDGQTLTTSFVYHPVREHYLTQVIDPLGRPAITTTYDDEGRIATITDGAGNTSVFDHSEVGVERVQDANGVVTALQYDERGNVLEERRGEHLNSSGQTAYDSITRYRYIYQRDGQHSANSDREWRVTQVFLDSEGNVIKETTTEYDYDATGNVTKITDTVGGETLTREFSYNEFANVTRVTDELGRPTIFNYDSSGNLREIVNATGDASYITYDAQGRPLTYTDFRGFTTTFAYQGSQSQPWRVYNPDHTDDAPSFREFTYDALGNVTRTVDEEGIVTQNRYDDQGRVIYERIGDDAPVEYEYTGHLQTRRIVRRSQVEQGTTDIVTEFGYWPNDLLRYEVDALGAVTGYEYDANGNRTFLGRWNTLADYFADVPADETGTNLRASRDRYDHATFEHVFVYDRLNRLDYEVDDVQLAAADEAGIPLNQITVRLDYDYDSAGNQTRKIDRNGRVRTFEYDERNRLVAEQWFENTADTTPDRSFTWTYCTCGSVSEAVEYAGEVGESEILSRYTYTHDLLNRVTSVDNAGTKDMPHVILSYAYDDNGNRTRVEDNLGVAVVSTYDNRNRLDTRAWENLPNVLIENAVDEVLVDFDYYRNGAESQLRRYDVDETTGALTLVGRTDYGNLDATGRVRTISHRDAMEQAIAEYTYGFDRLGLVKDLLYNNRDDQYDFDVTYSYDDLGQLTDADYTDATTARGIYTDELYRYDKNGNRTTARVLGEDVTYTTGRGNQLDFDTNFDYRYDPEGNLVRKTDLESHEVTTYEYDHRNLMVRATIYSKAPEDGGIITAESTNRYDIDGRRIAFTTDDDGDGPHLPQETRVVYNGDDTWADFDASDDLTARYLLGNRIDQLIARWTHTLLLNGDQSWYLADRLGTVQALITSAATVNHVAFNTFGAAHLARPATRFLFTGRELDSITHQYYFRARFYDPIAGRFSQHDPLGFVGDSVNTYRYVRNMPTILTDPTGENVIAEFSSFIRNSLTTAALYTAYAVIPINVIELAACVFAPNREELISFLSNLRDVIQAPLEFVIGFVINRVVKIPPLAYISCDTVRGLFREGLRAFTTIR